MRLLPLTTILAGAAALRFLALDFGRGVPLVRPDELGIGAALGWVWGGPVLPTLFLYGGGYYIPLWLFVGVVHGGHWPSSITDPLTIDPLPFIHAARLWSALVSTATVGLTYAAGVRVGGRAAGLIAAALVAVSPLAVREAHFAKADSAAACAGAVLALALAWRWTPGTRRAAVLGAVGALVMSTKACVGFLPAVAIALACPPGTSGRRIDLRSLLLGGATLVAVVLALNPRLLAHLAALRQAALLGRFGLAAWLPGHDVVPSPLHYHVGLSLRHGCGLGFTLLAGPALAWALLVPGAPRLLALAILGYGATLLASPMMLARYVLPMIPALAVLVAAMVIAATDRLGRARLPVVLGVAVLLLFEPLAGSVGLVERLERDDTRALAAEWIAAHVPADARLVSWGAPSVATDYGATPAGGRRVFTGLPPGRWRAEAVGFVVVHDYPLPYSSVPLPASTPALERVAVFDPFSGPLNDPVLEPLDAFYLPLAHFTGIVRPGPRITIYALQP